MRRKREYWEVAAGFGLVFGAMAIVEPYLVQHLLALGFTGSQVGTLLSVVSLIGIVFVPWASSAADRSGHQRRFATLATVLQALGSAVMGLATALPVIAGAVIPFRYFSGLGMNLRNRLALYWLEQQHSQDFGSLRLWGSVGYSLCVLTGGLVAERLGIPFLFVVSSGLMLLSLPLLRPFAAQLPVAPAKSRQGRMSASMQLVLLVTGLTALARTAYAGWAQDFLDTTLQGGESAVGLFMALIALIEVPVMFTIHRLIDRWGANVLWVLGLLLLGGGFAGLAAAQTVPGALLVTLPVGVGQGLMIVAPVVLIGQVSKPHNVTLNLALSGVLGSVGTMIGSPIAGTLFDRLGARPLFLIGAAGMFLAAFTLAAGRVILRRAAPRPQPAGD